MNDDAWWNEKYQKLRELFSKESKMSGGHWDYSETKARYYLEDVATDVEVQQRWPILAKVIGNLALWLNKTNHAMDWDLSGDSSIKDDAAFDLSTVGALLDLVLKALPDELFERGKWATIQNWQGQTGSENSPAFPKGE